MSAQRSGLGMTKDFVGYEAYHRFLMRVITDLKVGSALSELAEPFARLGASVLALAQENGNGHSRHIDLCILAPMDDGVRERITRRANQLFRVAAGPGVSDWEIIVRSGRDLLSAGGPAVPDAWADMPIAHSPSSPVRAMLLFAAPSNQMLDRVREGGEKMSQELGLVFDAVERMNQLSARDPMTGLYNRRGLDEELQRIWNQCGRAGQPVSLLFLDMDNLRIINDTHGHLVGDQVITELAAVLKSSIRAQDLAARYGGDEMVVALPATRSEDARIFSERLLNDIRETVFGQPDHTLHLSVSIGISGAVPGTGGYSIKQLIEDGDHALLEAKRNGRDQFKLHPAVESQTLATAVPMETVAAETRPEVGHILVVDDEEPIAHLLVRFLSTKGHSVAAAHSARQAMETLRQSPSRFDLLITDIHMPGESGLDLMRQVEAFDEDIVMLVITGEATVESAVGSLRYGAFDYLQKPLHLPDLEGMVKRAMEYRRLKDESNRYRTRLEAIVQYRGEQLKQAFSDIRKSYEFTLEALASLLDAREHSTGQHSIRVRDISLCVGGVMGMSDDELDHLDRGALLHDIGKIAIPDSILLKPGPLTAQEMALMRTHVDVGFRILSGIPYLTEAARIVQSHHERFDGTGYPKGLKGAEIPLAARLFTAVDSYDAIRSPRPYHAGRSAEEALRQLVIGSGTQFDPDIVEAFTRHQPEIEELGRWDKLPKGMVST